jgi:hypothetical protein
MRNGRAALFRLDVRFGEVEEDAGHLDVAAIGQPALECVGIGHRILLHRLHFDDQQHVHGALPPRQQSRLRGQDAMGRIHGTSGYPLTAVVGLTFRLKGK